MRSWTYTGRRRYRSETKWGRERIILQVEKRGFVATYVGGHVDVESRSVWYDATTADLTVREEVPP